MSLTIEEIKHRSGFENPVRVVHTLCGQILFWTDGVPRQKIGILNPAKVMLHNGVVPKEGDPIYCVGCGYGVRKNQMSWLMNDE